MPRSQWASRCFVGWSLRNARIDGTGFGFDGVEQGRMLLAASPNDPTAPLRSAPQVAIDALHNLTWHAIYHVPQQTIPGAWLPEIWSHLGALEAPAALALTIPVCAAALWARAAWPVIGAIAPAALLCAVLVQGGGARYWTNVSFLLLVAAAIRLAPWLERRSPRFRSAFFAALLACA